MIFDRFQQLEEEFIKKVPNLKVFFKDEFWLMKLIGKLMFFNKSFMTNFVTTLGYKIYFPSRSKLENSTDNHSLVTLSHEYMHARDAQKLNPILFGLLYSFPQILSLLFLLLCFYKIWLGLILFSVCLAPIPAFFRMRMERRGYATSLFAIHELQKENGLDKETCREILMAKVEEYNKHFTGGNYYWMWPFGVKKYLTKVVDDILNDKLVLQDEVFQEVRDAFNKTK